jgi:triacylglycerol lipase
MPDSYDPRSERQRLIREVLSWAAHGLLYGFGFLPSLHRPRRARDIRTLVFVHGLGANRASFFPLQGYLKLHGHARQLSFNYSAEGGRIEHAALELKRILDRNVRGGRIDLVGHSMGGLVARYYVQKLGGSRRVDRLITIATPHGGTYASAYMPTRVVSHLRPKSAFLEELDALSCPPGLRCLSIAAGRDLMVLPAEASYAPFGDVLRFDDLGHLDVLLSPRVFHAIAGFLEPRSDRHGTPARPALSPSA